MTSFVILIFIIAIIFFVSKLKGMVVIGFKMTRLLLLSYVGLLVVATAISMLFPQNSLSYDKVSQEELLEEMGLQQEVIEAANRGIFKEPKGFTVKKKWTFPVSKDRIILTKPEAYYSQVFVEMSSELQGEIQVTNYVGRSLINGMDVTKERDSVDVSLSEDQLTIKSPAQVDFKFAEISTGFPFNQFSGDIINLFSSDFDSYEGMDIIYMKVPENLEIEGEVVYVN